MKYMLDDATKRDESGPHIKRKWPTVNDTLIATSMWQLFSFVKEWC